MAIGTAAAIVGGASVLGSVLSSRSQNKAINRATDASTESNAASLALQGRMFDTASSALAPYQNRGNVAGDQIMALLGLGGNRGGPQQIALPGYQPAATSPYGNPPASSLPGDFNSLPLQQQKSLLGTGTQWGGIRWDQGMGRYVLDGDEAHPLSALNYSTQQAYQPTPQPTQQVSPQSAQSAAEDAFDIFRNSTGYQFRYGQGIDALDASAASRGMLRSGPQMKALEEYGQNIASGEFGNYMGYLANQQGVGLSGASALAGVGQNYANAATGINNNNASVLGNAALARGNANSNMWNGILGGLGTVFGSSYGK